MYGCSIAYRHTVIRLGRDAITFKESEVALLLKALRDLNDRDADSVAEEIEALDTARVPVDLTLTEPEAGALVSALTRAIGTAATPLPHFIRLLTLARERRG